MLDIFGKGTACRPAAAEVSVADMALRREKRASEQRELLIKHGMPLICVTMNAAGPIKRSGLLDWAFIHAVGAVLNALVRTDGDGAAAEVRCIVEKTGCEAMLAVRLDASEVKRRMTEIENASELGRLFDIDVLGTDGAKLSRDEPRRCLICSERASVCARSRRHTVRELQERTFDIIADAFSKNAAVLAYRSLYDEVHVTPKPGLVDERGSGANADMDIEMFERSAAALTPFFERMARAALSRCRRLYGGGADTIDYSALMTELREIGVEAERKMFEATGGVNTHKGAVYSIGLIISAYALAAGGASLPSACGKEAGIAELCAAFAAELASSVSYASDSGTHGAAVRRRYGVGGAPEQAMAGFPAAVLAKKLYEEHLGRAGKGAAVSGWTYALLGIMAELDDNNALKRGGRRGAEFVKARAGELLALGSALDESMLLGFDGELIGLNISCGGAADMLGAAMLLSYIENDCGEIRSGLTRNNLNDAADGYKWTQDL